MFEDLKTIIRESIEIKVPALKPETRLYQDLGADFLDMIEIEMAIEDHFKIEIIKDRVIYKTKTLADLQKEIEKRIKK